MRKLAACLLIGFFVLVLGHSGAGAQGVRGDAGQGSDTGTGRPLSAVLGIAVKGPGTYALQSNRTVTGDVRGTCDIIIDTSRFTLTFTGNFTAPPCLQFTAPVAGLRYARPEWFGAKGDGSADDGPAFTQTGNSLVQSGGSIDATGHDRYYFRTTWTLAKPARIFGAGSGKTAFIARKRPAPNGFSASQTILRAVGTHGLAIKDILFDGNVGPAERRQLDFKTPKDNQSLIEIEGAAPNIPVRDITIENVHFIRYYGPEVGSYTSLPEGTFDDYDRYGPLYIHRADRVILRNIEMRHPSYGDHTRLIDVTNLKIDGFRAVWPDSDLSSFGTPINVWGINTEHVDISNFDIRGRGGSAMNIGGKGDIRVYRGTVSNSKASGAGGIDVSDESTFGQYPTKATDQYGITIGPDIRFQNVTLAIIAGCSTCNRVRTYGVNIFGNSMENSNEYGAYNSIITYNSGNVSISKNNIVNGHIRTVRCDSVEISDNTLDGMHNGAPKWIYSSPFFVETRGTPAYIWIHNNKAKGYRDAALTVYNLFSPALDNVFFTDNDIVYSGPFSTPTDGRYINVGGPGGKMIGRLTIGNNRLNGADYVPFRGSDAAVYAATVDSGPGLTKTGTFTRDMSQGSGPQAITGIPFKPQAVLFRVVTSTGTTSWGFWKKGAVESPRAQAGGAGASHGHGAPAMIRAETGRNDSCVGVPFLSDKAGFAVNWTTTGAPKGILTVTYLAIK